ncbi:transposable element Tcb2 transposase [Trichonephila clavipes]|nr:transposable element Tcb2 transposase [Trichonephila clavipes]
MGLLQADAARRLNVSRSVVRRLWDQYQSEDSVSRRPVPGRPRATTPAEDRFQLFRHEGEEPLLCRSSLQTTFKHQEEESPLLRCEIVFTMQICMQEDQLYESRFTMESDSGRLLIWREQRTRYHQSNTVERHSYRGGGILVWAGISLGGHTDLHVFHGGTVTGLRYWDETLDPYVRPYAAAIGNDFILMDDNARPHRARIVEEYLEDHGLERMEWPARSPDLNPIEHLWDYLGREVAALNPPPRSLHELKQGLLCVWSSLPIPVSDNLINSMGNRCRQCIQPSHSSAFDSAIVGDSSGTRILEGPSGDFRGLGSRVVKVSIRGSPCQEFKPSTTKDPQCRAAMHVRSVESSNGVVWSLGEGMPAHVSSTSLDYGSKLRGSSPKALVKLTVWCALWAGGIIGPYFFKNDEGHNVTVNGDRYRAMITNFFIPELNNHDVQELWFQQDGATCYTARATIDLLKNTFGDRLISRFGPVNWPPRSCDLTSLDYFLLGYVKSLVYVDKPQTFDHLEDNIRRVISDIRPQMLEKVIEN